MNRFGRIVLAALIAVLLFCGAGAAYENAVTNGDFSNGLNGWSQSTNSGGYIYVNQGAAQLSAESSDITYLSRASISQNVNLVGVNTISFSARASGDSNGRMYVYVGNTAHTFSPSISWQTYTINVGSYSGTYSIEFESATVGPYSGGTSTYVLEVDDIQANYPSPYTVTDISLTPAEPNVNTQAQISFTYSGGNAPTSEGQQYLYFNAGGSTYQVDLYDKTSPLTVSYTFSNSGTQSIYAYGVGPQSTSSSYSEAFTILPAKPAGLSLTSTPADGIIEVGDSITFVASASSGGSVTSWTWDFGDGSAPVTTTTATASHTYTETGTYDVTITANGPGGSTSYVAEAAVYVGETSVTLDKTPAIYYIGEDTEIIADYTITPFDAAKTYTLEFWKLNEDYSLNSRVNSIPITESSGSATIPITGITSNNYYAVYIVVDGGQIAGTTCTVRYDGNTLTVNILSGNAPLTASTTVELSDTGGNLLDTKTTNTGQAVFAPVADGTYLVTANATGYNTVSQTVTIGGDTTVDLDVGGAVISGIGAEYEPITATWTFYSETGALIPGITVTLKGIEQSFDIGFLNNLYNMVFGEQLLDTQKLTTDSRGQVTFICLPNVQYKLSYTYGGKTYEKTYNIGSSKPFYSITVPTISEVGDITKDITVVVRGEGGLITVNYTDSTLTTTSLKITILDADRTQLEEWSAPTQQADVTFQLSDYAGKEFFVIVEAANSHGTYEREYPLWFNGPRLDFGLPDGLLIWLALISACALGGIFAGINVSMGAMVVSIYLWIMYAIGWLWEMEELMGTPGLIFTLTIATLFSALFMFAEGRG